MEATNSLPCSGASTTGSCVAPFQFIPHQFACFHLYGSNYLPCWHSSRCSSLTAAFMNFRCSLVTSDFPLTGWINVMSQRILTDSSAYSIGCNISICYFWLVALWDAFYCLLRWWVWSMLHRSVPRWFSFATHSAGLKSMCVGTWSCQWMVRSVEASPWHLPATASLPAAPVNS